MRAVLRYRQIPFKWVPQHSKWDDLPPFPLIPAIAFPDETGAYTDEMIDSSPLIMRLEGMYSERSLVPTDAVVAFIDYLLANEAAMEAGAETFSCVIDGHPYSQGTFVYQRKCLKWIREEYAKLSTADRHDVDALLAGTGCEILFTS
jgi:hypothetical protein